VSRKEEEKEEKKKKDGRFCGEGSSVHHLLYVLSQCDGGHFA